LLKKSLFFFANYIK
jgi:hypothetical protein